MGLKGLSKGVSRHLVAVVLLVECREALVFAVSENALLRPHRKGWRKGNLCG